MSDPSSLLSVIQQLIEKWRFEAERMKANDHKFPDRFAVTRCADELEALLPALRVDEQPPPELKEPARVAEVQRLIALWSATNRPGHISSLAWEMLQTLSDALQTASVSSGAVPQDERKIDDLDVEAMRGNLHGTFSGGWHRSKDGLEAFHHGMDTVCNVLASWLKGDGSNGILPERLSPHAPKEQP